MTTPSVDEDSAVHAREPIGSVRRRRVNRTHRAELHERLEALILEEGFTALTVDEMTQRLRCSKATLYAIAPSKEQLVLSVTRRFFAKATEQIEAEIATVTEGERRIAAYLAGVGTAMARCGPAFYADMVSFAPTAEIYRRNSDAAARRVHELIEDGVRSGKLRATDGRFAAQLIAMAIDGVQSGALLESTGLNAGAAYAEMADLLLHGLAARPDPATQGSRT
jgi:AcrR family transcriptional regulator